MGWVFVVITSLYVLVNLFFILKDMGSGLFQRLKPHFIRVVIKLRKVRAKKENSSLKIHQTITANYAINE